MNVQLPEPSLTSYVHPKSVKFDGLHKGRHVKAFLRNEKLQQQSKLRRKQLKKIVSALRSCMSSPLGTVTIIQINEWLSIARNANEVSLDLDIFNLERFKTKYLSEIKNAVTIQRFFRGFVGRKVNRMIKQMKEINFDRERFRKEIILKFSKGFVDKSISVAAALYSEKMRKYRKCFVYTYSSISYVITINTVPQVIRKSNNLCTNCMTCRIKAVCTCDIHLEKEIWFIKIYNPISKETIEERIDSKFLSIVLQYCSSISNKINSNSSIDEFFNNLQNIWGLRIQSMELLKIMKHLDICFDNENSIFKAFDTQFDTLCNIKEFPDERVELFSQMITLDKIIKDKFIYLDFLYKRLNSLNDNLIVISDSIHVERVNVECNLFECEDILSKLSHQYESILIASSKFKEVMNLTLNSVNKVYCDSIGEFESGNSWMEISNFRKNEESYKAQLIELSSARLRLKEVLSVHENLILKRRECINDITVIQEKIRRLKDEISLYENMLSRISHTTSRIMRAIILYLPFSRFQFSYDNRGKSMSKVLNKKLYQSVSHFTSQNYVLNSPWVLLKSFVLSWEYQDYWYSICIRKREQYISEIYFDIINHSFVISMNSNLPFEENVNHLDFANIYPYTSQINKRLQDYDGKQISSIFSSNHKFILNEKKTLYNQDSLLYLCINEATETYFSFEKFTFHPSTLVNKKCSEYSILMRNINILKHNLRFNVHTGRPCIGLLHLHNRIDNFYKILQKCRWYSNLQHKDDPLISYNYMLPCMLKVQGKLFYLSFYIGFKSITLKMQSVSHILHLHFEITLTLESISKSMGSCDLLMNIFHNELKLNKFSYQVMKHISDNLFINFNAVLLKLNREDAKLRLRDVNDDSNYVFKYSIKRIVDNIIYTFMLYESPLEYKVQSIKDSSNSITHSDHRIYSRVDILAILLHNHLISNICSFNRQQLYEVLIQVYIHEVINKTPLVSLSNLHFRYIFPDQHILRDPLNSFKISSELHENDLVYLNINKFQLVSEEDNVSRICDSQLSLNEDHQISPNEMCLSIDECHHRFRHESLRLLNALNNNLNHISIEGDCLSERYLKTFLNSLEDAKCTKVLMNPNLEDNLLIQDFMQTIETILEENDNLYVLLSLFIEAIFLHCNNCELPLSICQFPGCRCIRGLVRAYDNDSYDTIRKCIIYVLHDDNSMIWNQINDIVNHLNSKIDDTIEIDNLISEDSSNSKVDHQTTPWRATILSTASLRNSFIFNLNSRILPFHQNQISPYLRHDLNICDRKILKDSMITCILNDSIIEKQIIKVNLKDLMRLFGNVNRQLLTSHLFNCNLEIQYSKILESISENLRLTHTSINDMQLQFDRSIQFEALNNSDFNELLSIEFLYGIYHLDEELYSIPLSEIKNLIRGLTLIFHQKKYSIKRVVFLDEFILKTISELSSTSDNFENLSTLVSYIRRNINSIFDFQYFMNRIISIKVKDLFYHQNLKQDPSIEKIKSPIIEISAKTSKSKSLLRLEKLLKLQNIISDL